MSDLNKTYLYRMVHIENVKHILQYGITHQSSPNANQNYISIGDSSIISKRNSFRLSNGKVLGQYIPFYFGKRMPMLYVIQKGFNGVNALSPEKIVYCLLSIQQVINHQLPFIYTNGHAVNGLTEFFNESDIKMFENNIDRVAISCQDWKSETDLDLKRRKEAEFLIESDIPATAIVGWIVYNEKAKTELKNMGIADSKIIIKPDYYF